jgi:hypothetical protein
MFDSHELSDVEFDGLCNKTIEVVFPNGESDFAKCLWRLTNGDYMHSFHIARNIMLRYGFDIDDHIFDAAVGEINGGIEVEWLTYDEHQSQRQYAQLVKENDTMAITVAGKKSDENSII